MRFLCSTKANDGVCHVFYTKIILMGTVFFAMEVTEITLCQICFSFLCCLEVIPCGVRVVDLVLVAYLAGWLNFLVGIIAEI